MMETTKEQLIQMLFKQISNFIDEKSKNNISIKSAVIDKVHDNQTIDLHIPPDNKIFTNILNQSIYRDLKQGDCVKVIQENSSASNMWIIGKHEIETINIPKEIHPIGTIYWNKYLIEPEKIFMGKWKIIETSLPMYCWERTE